MQPTPADIPAIADAYPETSAERLACAEAFGVLRDLAGDHPHLPIEHLVWHISADGIDAEITSPGLDAPSKDSIIAAFASHFDAVPTVDARGGDERYGADVRLSVCVRRHGVRLFLFALLTPADFAALTEEAA